MSDGLVPIVIDSSTPAPERAGFVGAPVTVDEAALLLDRKLVMASKAGDQSSFGQLVARHEKGVHAYLRSRLLQASDADDLTQEVFLRFCMALERFDPQYPVRPFLSGIARNVLCEHLRTLTRRKEVVWAELCLELDKAEEEAEEPLYADVQRHLAACISSLGPNAATAIEMHYRQRLRLSAISRQLGRSLGAVKLLLFRARRSLKRCLEKKLTSGR